MIINESVILDTKKQIEGYLAHKWGLTNYLSAQHTYKTTAPQTGFHYVSGNSDILEINGTNAIIRGSGTVTVTANAPENPTAFAAIPVSKQIIIEKAQLTVTGQDLSLSVGASIPDLNYTISGWKYNDSSLATANLADVGNLILWLDAADSSTLFADTSLTVSATSSVAGWKDKSGNANHATQSNATYQPTYNAAGMSGRPGIDFSTDRLSIPSVDMLGKTLVAVVQPDASQTQQILSSSSTNVQLRLSSSNQLQYASSAPRYNNGTASSETIANDQISVVSFVLDSQLKFSVNGSLENSGVSQNSSGSTTYNQLASNNGHENFNGKMGEFIILNSISSSDREKVEGYLAHKWGLKDSLPSNHSHKNITMGGLAVTTDATSSSSAGKYYIRPGGAFSDKYTFSYVDGDLILDSKTAQSITWDQNFSGIGVGQIVDLNASASSNLAVQYTVSDTSVAELAVTNQSSLKAWWKLDETNGVDASDSSIVGSTGSVENSTSGHWNPGKFGNALSLDGVNDYVHIYSYNGIGGGTRRTIALWFKTSTANKPILQYGASGNGTLLKLSLNSSGAAVLDLGGTSITSSTGGLADGNWHHLVATLPAGGTIGDARLYIDGTSNQVTNTTSVNTSTSNNLVIGRDGPSGSAYFNGQIDDVRFYEAELNSTLVSQLYGDGNGDFNRLKIKAAGTVTLTATQSGNSSYAAAPSVDLTATFDKSNQTISFGTLPDKSVGDFNFIPTAVASSGMDVTFTSSNEEVAKVLTDNRTIQIRSAGTATITASQAGDDAYNAATSVAQPLTVGYYNLQDDSFPGIRLWLDGNNLDGDGTEDTTHNGSTLIPMGWRSVVPGLTSRATTSTAGRQTRPTVRLMGQPLSMAKVCFISPLPIASIFPAVETRKYAPLLRY